MCLAWALHWFSILCNFKSFALKATQVEWFETWLSLIYPFCLLFSALCVSLFTSSKQRCLLLGGRLASLRFVFMCLLCETLQSPAHVHCPAIAASPPSPFLFCRCLTPLSLCLFILSPSSPSAASLNVSLCCCAAATSIVDSFVWQFCRPLLIFLPLSLCHTSSSRGSSSTA